MIELRVNGATKTIDPKSLDELSSAIAGPIPRNHGICRVWVDGRELPGARIEDCDLGRAREIAVESAPLSEIAKSAVAETTEWIGRICQTLDGIAADYRSGRDRKATERLATAADALHVLSHLLHGIGSNIAEDATDDDTFAERWSETYAALLASVEAIAANVCAPGGGDPVALADQVGYALPRCLGTFRLMLEQIRT